MKVYYTQDKISSNFKKFFFSLSSSFHKPIIKNLSIIISSMIDAESVVTIDIAKKVKQNYFPVFLESIERRFRRFFNSFSSIAYFFYDVFIKFIISKFKLKHSDFVHISFDHMFVKNKFTILLFSLRIGKQGIPIWFRCFKGKHNPEAYTFDLIKSGISYCFNLFYQKNCKVIFLADRWFPHIQILQHIQDIGAFFYIRSPEFFTYHYYNSKGFLKTSHLRDITQKKHSSKILYLLLCVLL